MCLFGKRHKRSLEKEVCNLHFRNPVGVQYVSGNLLLAGKHCALSGFVTLNPPKENVLQWITGLQQFRRKTVLAVNISSDIFRTFSLVYDFADFIIIDPDSDNGIDSPDVGDTAQLLEQIVSQRLCYEHYTPVFLRLSHGTTPAELHPLLGCCQLYGIDGAVVHGSRKMQSARPGLAETPHKFAQITAEPSNNQFLVPRVSSERRAYVPVGIFGTDTVISDSAQVVSNAEPWLFSVINSRMHMVWLRYIGGKMKTDYRYAKDLVYNTFPFPIISDDQKSMLKQNAFAIIEARENHPGKTLAKLYNPESMPSDLKKAHEENDLAIEKIYRAKPFASDEERLEFLFKLYEQMISEERNRNTLFAKQYKPRKRVKQ